MRALWTYHPQGHVRHGPTAGQRVGQERCKGSSIGRRFALPIPSPSADYCGRTASESAPGWNRLNVLAAIECSCSGRSVKVSSSGAIAQLQPRINTPPSAPRSSLSSPLLSPPQPHSAHYIRSLDFTAFNKLSLPSSLIHLTYLPTCLSDGVSYLLTLLFPSS